MLLVEASHNLLYLKMFILKDCDLNKCRMNSPTHWLLLEQGILSAIQVYQTTYFSMNFFHFLSVWENKCTHDWLTRDNPPSLNISRLLVDSAAKVPSWRPLWLINHHKVPCRVSHSPSLFCTAYMYGSLGQEKDNCKNRSLGNPTSETALFVLIGRISGAKCFNSSCQYGISALVNSAVTRKKNKKPGWHEVALLGSSRNFDNGSAKITALICNEQDWTEHWLVKTRLQWMCSPGLHRADNRFCSAGQQTHVN